MQKKRMMYSGGLVGEVEGFIANGIVKINWLNPDNQLSGIFGHVRINDLIEVRESVVPFFPAQITIGRIKSMASKD